MDGLELISFPTLGELEIVENYVYGITLSSLSEIRSRVGRNEDLAIVVFASEYRPAPETVHRKHADLCFSRTGVARVGTTESPYSPKNRGFVPNVMDDDFAFRVLPARYSVYIAVQRKGNEQEFGPISRIEEQRESDNDYKDKETLLRKEEFLHLYDILIASSTALEVSTRPNPVARSVP